VQDSLVGHILDGRYRVDGCVARGGMATVYVALDTRLDRRVALKVMHASLAEDPHFVSRFIHEARSAARLSHSNVVAVYDQGADAGYVFLAMEYVEGRTLRDTLDQRWRLTPRDAFSVLEPALAALGAAHAAGLVHRDVKPENVLLADDGRVKVADFGLVHAVTHNSSTAPTSPQTTGPLIGTVNYLAPEQIQQGRSDPRSDVYAAGIMLYEMLTGRRPHDSSNPMHVVYRNVNEDVPPPSRERPALCSAVDDLVAVATAREPTDRPPDAKEFLIALRATREAMSESELDAEAVDEDEADSTRVQPVVPPVPDSTMISQLRAARDSRREDLDPWAEDAWEGGAWAEAHGSHHYVRRALMTVLLLAVAGTAGGTWWWTTGRFVPVPPVVNASETDALRALRTAGLTPAVRTQASPTVARGQVVDTAPRPSQRALRGGTVTVVVSSGVEQIRVPQLVGRNPTEARTDLEQLGLTIDPPEQQFSDTVRPGETIGTNPRPGTPVKRGSAVALVISKGPAPLRVPNLFSQPVSLASVLLQQSGLSGQVTSRQFSDTVPAGSVIAQTPPPGTGVDNTALVGITLSDGPPPQGAPPPGNPPPPTDGSPPPDNPPTESLP
jgi:eukaryotic-like serine/threonine-protein kinase